MIVNELVFEYKRLFPEVERGIQQCSDEIEQLIDIIGGNSKFHSMVEIGVDDGGSMWMYSQLFGAPHCTFVGIEKTVKPMVYNVVQKLKECTTTNFVIAQGSSEHILLREFDFLHIDGDHSYEAVKGDFVRNWPALREGGVILLHDTLLWEGTIQFRKELEQSGNFKMTTLKGHNLISGEFGKEGNNLSTGITVVWKG